jgi:hypothetical protein
MPDAPASSWGLKVANNPAIIVTIAAERASQSTVIAPASLRQNFDLARKVFSAEPRVFGVFGPAAPVGACLVVGSVISTSTLTLPKRGLDSTLPEKVVKLGQKHGQLMKNRMPTSSINHMI